jgi:hypothetical protein
MLVSSYKVVHVVLERVNTQFVLFPSTKSRLDPEPALDAQTLQDICTQPLSGRHPT